MATLCSRRSEVTPFLTDKFPFPFHVVDMDDSGHSRLLALFFKHSSLQRVDKYRDE